MDKQDAVKRIEAIESEARALRAIIEAPEAPEVPVRWRPKGDEDFWAINTFGESARVCMSPTREAYGNCFKTREHAEIASKAVSVTLKVCAAAFTVDPDAGGFIAGARRYSVFLKSDGTFDASGYPDDMGKQVYVHTIEQATRMAAMLNAEGV